MISKALQVILKGLGKFIKIVASASDEIIKIIKAIGGIIIKYVKTLIGGIVDIIKTVGNVINKIITSISIGISKTLDSIANVIEAVGKSISNFVDSIYNGVTKMMRGLASVVKSIGDGISGVIKSITGGIAKVLNAVSGGIVDTINAVTASIKELSNISGDSLMSTAKGIGAVGLALAAFGATSVIGGLGTLFGKLTKTDPIERLTKLSKLGSGLQLTAEGIKAIATAFDQLKIPKTLASDLNAVIKSMSKLANEKVYSSLKGITSGLINKVGGLLKLDTEVKTTSENKIVTEQYVEDGEVRMVNTSGDALLQKMLLKLDTLITVLGNKNFSIAMDGKKVSKELAKVAIPTYSQ